MKHTVSLLFSFLMILSVAQAQKTLTEGYIKMEIISADSDDPSVKQMMQMMNGTETEFYFNKDKSFSTVDMMGGMMTIQYLSDYKTILGYETYKAVVKTKGTEDIIYEAYITEEIKASSSMIKGMQDFVLDGFPLEYTIKNPMMTMTINAVEVNDKLDKKVFDIDTAGYTKMTMEEFSKSMGGMNGLGF